VLRATVTNQRDLSASETLNVTVVPTPTHVVLRPSSAVVPALGRLPLAVNATDQFGAPIPADRLTGDAAPRWEDRCGTIDSGGVYAAPDFATWDKVSVTVGSVWTSAPLYVYDGSAPVLLSAASRKVHGDRGPVDLPLPLYGGAAAVEPRRGGPTTIVFTFDRDVYSAGGPIGPNNFAISNAEFRAARLDGRVLSVDLGAIADQTEVTVFVEGIVDAGGVELAGFGGVEVRALYGDANREGAVTPADALAVRRQLLRPPRAQDLLLDLDLSGSVSAADWLVARRRAAVPSN
jgi:hypothetical protein